MSRQYVEVKFRANDKRTYTYHHDGEPVVPGDKVKIAGRGEEGWQAVNVEAISFTKPPFDTKPILGRVDPAQPDMLDEGEPDLFAVTPMGHRCATCATKDGHLDGCPENEPPEDEPDRVDCGNCYGNGCWSCGNRGWVETATGREKREDAEDRRAEDARERRMLGDD